jgi:general secretion pathway protein B
MSYILEALKKSQQERELGQVPTLEMGPFAGVRRPHRGNPWATAALGLAGLAVAIALYAVLRQPQTAAPAPQETVATASPGVGQPPAPTPPGGPAQALAQVGPVVSALPMSPPILPPPAVPVVPVPGVAQVLPNGADSRAGAAAGPLPAAVAPQFGGPAPGEGYPAHSLPTGDPMVGPGPKPDGMETEEWSDDWMEMDQEVGPAEPGESIVSRPSARRPPRPVRQAPPTPKSTPIPQDLRDDVAAFRDELQRERNGGKPKAPVAGDPKKLRLTDDLQARLPAFIMTAQIYDPDPTRRFVVINSIRYAVGETTREGLKVEQVLSDGVVLSFEGQRFFRRR